MKKGFYFFLVSGSVFLIMLAVDGCKKKEIPPVERTPVAWVVGQQDSTTYGMILYSADGGDTWARQGQGSPVLQGIDVIDVWALDEQNVWAVCSDNTVIRSTDAGQHWVLVPTPPNPSSPNLCSISILNNINIWISGEHGVVYHSADAGNTWTVFDTNFFHRGLMQGICAITSQVIYVVGQWGFLKGDTRGFIARTMDAGVTWDSITPGDDYNRNLWIGVSATDPQHVIVYGGRSHYTYTLNGGVIWNNDSVPGGGGGGQPPDINHLIMLDSQTWWGAFDMDNIFFTDDNGLSWTSQNSVGPQNMYLVGIDAFSDQMALITGQSAGYPPAGKILKTTNGGALWEMTYSCRSILNKVRFAKK
ncbi:MAG: YCF48-related protein [Bacteroidota bacterium]